jgi:hypothetical protein
VPDGPTSRHRTFDDFELHAVAAHRSALAGRHTRAARPMSRRHHGGRPHRQNGHARGAAPLASTQASPRHAQPSQAPRPPVDTTTPEATLDPIVESAVADAGNASESAASSAPNRPFEAPRAPNGHDRSSSSAASAANGSGGCTAPQLRRFIKSRPYVPMHELRRRFGINGSEDDMTLVEVDGSSVFVGLPAREGGLLGELLRGGEVGYELSLDPRSPVVVGLYPMRPVPRT